MACYSVRLGHKWKKCGLTEAPSDTPALRQTLILWSPILLVLHQKGQVRLRNNSGQGQLHQVLVVNSPSTVFFAELHRAMRMPMR